MVKKKIGDNESSNVERSVEEKSDQRGGLSKEAWIAIGTIGAALIAGVVTVATHVLPQAPTRSPEPTPSSSPKTSPALRQVSEATDSIVGKWAGTAKDNNGVSFQITLEVRKGCEINQNCGSISVSHVPCYGEAFLAKADAGDFEFRVDNFYGQSNSKLCQPGAGEHFRLRSDGKLVYSTSYEPRATGVLEKTGD